MSGNDFWDQVLAAIEDKCSLVYWDFWQNWLYDSLSSLNDMASSDRSPDKGSHEDLSPEEFLQKRPCTWANL